MIKLLNILSEEIGVSDEYSVVEFKYKSMNYWKAKLPTGGYVPGFPWYVYFNGLKLIEGSWAPGKNFMVKLIGDDGDFELNPSEVVYDKRKGNIRIKLRKLQDYYPQVGVPEKSNNLATPDKIRQALKIAFEDNWLEGDDMYSPGIRGIYTIGDKTGTDESWSVVNYFDTKTEVQKEINKKWKNEGKGDFIYWLADVFKNDIEFMNNLVERQWESIYNGYENERKVSEILSNELGGNSQLFPPGSKKDRYELIDMVINGDNYQIKPSSSVRKENGVWKVVTYGMNNKYKGKNLQYIAYGTNDNKVYVFPNKNYNASDSRYVEHYEDPLIYPNNQLSEQVDPPSNKLNGAIQSIIDQELINLREFVNKKRGESYWGGETSEIDSVEDVKVKGFYTEYMGKSVKRLHVIIYVSGSEYDFYNYSFTKNMIAQAVNKLMPGTKLFFYTKETGGNLGNTLSEQFNKKENFKSVVKDLLRQSLDNVKKDINWKMLGADSIKNIVVEDIITDVGPYNFMVFITLVVDEDVSMDSYKSLIHFISMDINRIIPKTEIVFNVKNNKSGDTDYLNEESNKDNFLKSIKNLMDQTLVKMKKETEEWGLGEMQEISEIEAVKDIEVVDYYNIDDKLIIHVILDVDAPIHSFSYFNSFIPNMEWEINKIIPTARLKVKLRDIRTFGPGIDW